MKTIWNEERLREAKLIRLSRTKFGYANELSNDKKAIESHSVYDVKRNKNDNINYRHRARIN